MLAKLRQWLRFKRGSRASHAAEWRDIVAVGNDGLSQFQSLAADALRAAMPNIQLVGAGETERFLTGTVPGTDVRVFIYEDQAEVSGLFSGEHHDYSSPGELIHDFVTVARRAGAA